MVQYEWLIYIVSDLRACTENLFKAVPVGAGAVFAYWVSLIFRFPAYPKDKSNNPIQTTSKAAQNKYPDPF